MHQINNKTIREIDWSIYDKRSVKAQLAGRGDFRAVLYRLFHGLFEFFRPGCTTEQVNEGFRQFCRIPAIIRHEMIDKTLMLAKSIRKNGLLIAVRQYGKEL